MSSKNKIIVLLGYDGCGKSSVICNLEENGFLTSSWQRLRELPQLRFMLEATINPAIFREDLLPRSRAAFLLLAIFAEYEFIIKPLLKRGSVIVDSYYLRPMAKELVKGKASTAVLDSLKDIQAPDAVIVFDIPLDIAFQRKKLPSINEVDKRQDYADYCRFQKGVLKTAIGMVPREKIMHIDASGSMEMTYNQVIDCLGVLLCQRKR